MHVFINEYKFDEPRGSTRLADSLLTVAHTQSCRSAPRGRSNPSTDVTQAALTSYYSIHCATYHDMPYHCWHRE